MRPLDRRHLRLTAGVVIGLCAGVVTIGGSACSSPIIEPDLGGDGPPASDQSLDSAPREDSAGDAVGQETSVDQGGADASSDFLDIPSDGPVCTPNTSTCDSGSSILTVCDA